jgi:hypothetical protein
VSVANPNEKYQNTEKTNTSDSYPMSYLEHPANPPGRLNSRRFSTPCEAIKALLNHEKIFKALNVS